MPTILGKIFTDLESNLGQRHIVSDQPFVKLIVTKLDQAERNLTAEFTTVTILPSQEEYEKAKDYPATTLKAKRCLPWYRLGWYRSTCCSIGTIHYTNTTSIQFLSLKEFRVAHLETKFKHFALI